MLLFLGVFLFAQFLLFQKVCSKILFAIVQLTIVSGSKILIETHRNHFSKYFLRSLVYKFSRRCDLAAPSLKEKPLPARHKKKRRFMWPMGVPARHFLSLWRPMSTVYHVPLWCAPCFVLGDVWRFGVGPVGTEPF